MRKLLVPILLAAAAGACTDGPQPVAPHSATHPRATTTPTTANVGMYWRTPDTLTIYDQRPELGVGAQSNRFTTAANGTMKLIRYSVDWDSTGAADADLGNAIQLAATAGVELEAVVHSTSMCRANVADPYGDYATYVAALVAKYPQVRFWELFNEENSAGWTDMFGGAGSGRCNHTATATTHQQGYNYAQMMKRAYPAIKAANSSAWVLMGGLAGADSAFINGFYGGGGKQYFDFLNIHIYGYGQDITEPFSRGDSLAAEAARNYDYGRPVWLTEFGHGGANESGGLRAGQYDTLQLNWWKQVMTRNSTSHTYAKMIGYFLLTTDSSFWPTSVTSLPAGRTRADYGAGILYMDGTARPTYSYVQSSGYNSAVFGTSGRTVTLLLDSPGMVPSGFTYSVVGPDMINIYNVHLNYRYPTQIHMVPGNTDGP